MDKKQITQILAAVARITEFAVHQQPRVGHHLKTLLDLSKSSTGDRQAQLLLIHAALAVEVGRTGPLFEDLALLQRELVPHLNHILGRIHHSEICRAEWSRWTHAVGEHRYTGHVDWVYAGTLDECTAFMKACADDGANERYSAKPMRLLERGQRIAALRSRRTRHELDDVPF